MALPTYMRGIPRAEWHRMFLRSANTTTADYHNRLYQNAQYRFTPRVASIMQGNIFSTPFRLMDMTLDPFTGTEVDAILRKEPEHFTRQWNRDRERDFKIDYMHGNAHECITCSKCMIMQQRMEMHRIIDT